MLLACQYYSQIKMRLKDPKSLKEDIQAINILISTFLMLHLGI